MITDIETLIDSWFTAVNTSITGTVNDYKKIDHFLTSDDIPANQKEIRYQVKISEINPEDFENFSYKEIKTEVELFYMIGNDRTKYTTFIDTYIRLLSNQVKIFKTYNGTYVRITDVKDFSFSDLNNIDKDVISAKLSLTFSTIDK